MLKKLPRVLIIGGDHHNTLAMIRCFGEKEIDLRILLHTEKSDISDIHLASSRYAENKIELVGENSEAIMDALFRNILPNEKQVLFPCSDFAEYIIDSHVDELKNSYILPGFQNYPGKVACLMNKMQQKMFAEKYHIPMAKTWLIKKENDIFSVPPDIIFPCILKPELSAMGSKGDIKICYTEQELTIALLELSKKGYATILLQQFLKKIYEVCAFGAMFDIAPHYSGGITKKINEYPPEGGGSLTFAQFTKSEAIEKAVNQVRDVLFDLGYRGMYDIEFLVCENKIYLNEINFRHSGNGYALIQNGVYSPYFYYLSVIDADLPTDGLFNINKEYFHMDEMLELQLLKSGGISVKNFIKSIFKAKAFAKFDIHDLKGSFAYYNWIFVYIRNKLFKKST